MFPIGQGSQEMADAFDLQHTIEAQRQCRAVFALTLPVQETRRGQPLQGGVVNAFDMEKNV